MSPAVTETLAEDEVFAGRLVLGSPSITAGIPGTGHLSITDIRRWLADPNNHRVLEVTLPLGLRNSQVVPIPAENPLTRAKIELGRQLFSDTRISKDQRLACVTCHSAKKRFTSDQISHPRLRETAVAFNRVFGHEHFWDGRAKSLEDQIRFTLEHPDEMNTSPTECVQQIGSVEGYRLQFDAVFGKLDFDSLCQAIAAFLRTIVTGPSIWDYDVELRRLDELESAELSQFDKAYVENIRQAAASQPLSAAARRGAELFFSERTGCSRCHSGPNFSDERFYDIGLRQLVPDSFTVRKETEDLGRFQVTNKKSDKYAFKTPTLRNVQLTGPYFHDGRFQTLGDVIDYFSRGGDVPNHELRPLNLSRDEILDLIAFLKSLTSSLPNPPRDRLPP
ncbi:cytochrome-c peroxidase [Anatilimnocola aggregata]|nr:cytochrome c peroxidase [Anatilimnocola aggregata]